MCSMGCEGGGGYLASSCPPPARCLNVATLAGRYQGFSNGKGAAASFNGASSVAVDASGVVYVADTGNNAIRKITRDGVVTTLAGNGGPGFVDGKGAAASFQSPKGVAVDASGVVYVADADNYAIRKITRDGIVTTLAGNWQQGFANGKGAAASFRGPSGVAVGADGVVYVADLYNFAIRKITHDGVVTTLAGNGTVGFANGKGAAASFSGPSGVAVGADGVVYVADTGNNAIRKITRDGVVTTLAGNGKQEFANGKGGAARFDTPRGVAVGADGVIYVADWGNSAIRSITPDGIVTTLAGGHGEGAVDGKGAVASFSGPTGVALGAGGEVYVADLGNNAIRVIRPCCSATVSMVIGSGAAGFANGKGAAASFNMPGGVAVDAGVVYVVDRGNNAIRKITRDGVVTTLAGNGTAGFANGKGVTAMFFYPQCVAVDASGVVYVTDSGNGAIRKITSDGVVTTLAGAPTFGGPAGVAVNAGGVVYVADADSSVISKITRDGVVTTLAGNGTAGFANGRGAAASFNLPQGVAVDASGVVYVADQLNNAIRKITRAGVVTTLAGAQQGFGDGNGAAASFRFPSGVAVDASGVVYVADPYNNAVRRITPNGDVTTLIRNVGATGVAVGPGGVLYVADAEHNVIRQYKVKCG